MQASSSNQTSLHPEATPCRVVRIKLIADLRAISQFTRNSLLSTFTHPSVSAFPGRITLWLSHMDDIDQNLQKYAELTLHLQPDPSSSSTRQTNSFFPNQPSNSTSGSDNIQTPQTSADFLKLALEGLQIPHVPGSTPTQDQRMNSRIQEISRKLTVLDQLESQGVTHVWEEQLGRSETDWVEQYWQQRNEFVNEEVLRVTNPIAMGEEGEEVWGEEGGEISWSDFLLQQGNELDYTDGQIWEDYQNSFPQNQFDGVE
ncbi:hypothetical protein TREMEDRAFT_62941 [Tremella mesenterica DSM 1558]|uniref:uncharacterized protein n=1 Tax=Tremella mesenterica (strain ATCC 24925 / CBS 8224 / DSM 1558 / NBRC 9311 / NRRL Y-6157 / RJB 2259-6 / UBC 559-6) TaxID=578456 RepID=UPI0003F49682|nr:uncharacterized protein TREMEDRAFT_62941 [Tremella mesenterica DSM 1558]EIW69212.1 hypothetical protein TREMEDRAFT_62941 [Tremella mesenterica DSM 1558]